MNIYNRFLWLELSSLAFFNVSVVVISTISCLLYEVYYASKFTKWLILFRPINLLIRFCFVRIEVREIGGRKCIVFSQQEDEDTTVATIIIRASTAHVLNDVEVNIFTCIYILIFTFVSISAFAVLFYIMDFLDEYLLIYGYDFYCN